MEPKYPQTFSFSNLKIFPIVLSSNQSEWRLTLDLQIERIRRRKVGDGYFFEFPRKAGTLNLAAVYIHEHDRYPYASTKIIAS